VSGSADGTGSAARFNYPAGVAVDGAGRVYMADTVNHTIRTGVNTNTNPCPNLVVNGSFEVTSPAMTPNTFNNSLDPTTGVPGWTTAASNFLEIWCNTVSGIPASLGTNQLEINAQSVDETVSQVVTGLSTTCPATFCFDYTGRFGMVGGTPNNDFTVTLSSGGILFSVALDPAAYAAGGWISFCTNFVPTASTITIAFRGQPHFSDGTTATQGGAHIDNVSLTQCCDNPCAIPLVINCATNKTVDCGTGWKFDLPTATSCCSTNVTITSAGFVTNGVCPKSITQNWLITDGCGNSNTCSQTVTVSSGTPCIAGETWTPRETNRIWQTVASSADGSKLVAVADLAQIIISTDYGATWSPRESVRNWRSVASSADGSKLIAVPYGDQVFVSTDSGTTWTPRGPYKNWYSVASSADGSKLVAVPINDQIFTSSDSGSTWTPHESNRNWLSVASSADGSKLVAVEQGGHIFTSTDSGVTWTSRESIRLWRSVASSADGTKLVAAAGNDQIFTSIDSGVSWTPRDTSRNWAAVASSTDGTRLIAGASGDQLFTSSDSGLTWTAHESARNWNSFASSSDGSKLVATVGGGRIYTSGCQALPAFVGGTNKTVNCGAPWNFDAPIVVDACNGNNTPVAILSTVTNGNCTQIITRTWAAVDPCGNSNTFSQTVTVRDITPPVITCPTNRIIVALTTNCQLEIPTIRPSASDNCTPASQLVYTQNPSAGAIVPGPCQLVTVTVRDACDNVSQCQVLVCGQDKTPPTLIYPKSVTVTNCIVPNVLALVSASDNCTASNQLVFTQSPPAGTPIAAGGNLVSVTVTDLNGNATTVVIPLTSGGTHSFLDVMFNTAVDSNKAVLPYAYPTGSVDPHYTLGPVPAGTPTGPGYYNAPNAIVFPIVLGLPPFTSSAWIVPGVEWAFVIYPPGFYTYTNQFVLPPGMDPLTASISGRWAADDSATMYLNGLAPANQVSSMAPIGYNHWTYFTVNSGFLAFPAINKLYFVVTNAPIVPPDNTVLVALRVEFTDASINCSTCTPPVILQKTRDQSLPLNSTAVFSVSVWGTPPLTLQWYHNGLPLTNGVHYPNGVTNTTLTITPLGYADAGIYTVAVSNSCGGTASAPAKLTVTRGWPWPWAWWNFSDIRNPMKATVGPDLIMEGTNIFGFSFGTTRDFDLPNIGGQIANVLYVPTNLPAGTFIQLPTGQLLGDNSASNYTIIMDFYAPSNATAPVTLFDIFPGGVSGQDRIQVKQLLNIGDGAEELSVSGTLGGTPFNLVSSVPLQLGAWNRVAMVAGILGGVVGSGTTDAQGFTVYVNGQPPVYPTGVSQGGAYLNGYPTPLIAVLSSPSSGGTTGEVYASSIAFFDDAMTPEMIASIGGCNNGPIPVNDPSMSVMPPVLSVNKSPNGINLIWDDPNGGTFFLEETSDLGSGVWEESILSFTQTEKNGNILTTANAIPSSEGRVKFYRLHNYKGIVTLVK
ncbi:MAG TPA: hypothetical protein DCQ92_03035, partial [Verrucomicrobia subdivision 3 bacterium]|nr:hypothetical protein [Limisphaerales bacterium]